MNTPPFSYADPRPYTVPWSLEDLHGPEHGVIQLPLTLAWSGRRHFDLASVPIAPEPIRAEIGELAARIGRGEQLGPALRHLAVRLQDPTADLVIAALILADERSAGT